MSGLYSTGGSWRVAMLLALSCAATPVSADMNQPPGARPDGAHVFLVYCAGCHGVDGLAAYPAAPSFSMGERLGRDDATLLQSVLAGKGAMPSWENKLSVPELRGAIGYLREMADRVRRGQAARQRALPGNMYRFRPVGEPDAYWWRGAGK